MLVEFRLKLLYQFSDTIIKCVVCGSLGWEWLQLENIRLMFSSFSIVSWKNRP